MIGRGVRSNRKSTLAQGADVPSGPSQGSVRLTVGSTGVYWLFPAASKRPGKVMANAFSAGFHRFIHRFLAVPVGSRERATR